MPEGASNGPDVTVVFIGENVGGGGSDIATYTPSGGIHAYSAGTTSCNIGNANAQWQSSSARHPVIGQNLYRLQNGVLEQVGLSWVKHSFCAVSEPGCKDPNNPFSQADDTPLACQPDPGCPWLGVGCADTYWGTLNGEYGQIGPRNPINASTGVFPFSYPNPTGPSSIRGRLQVAGTDLTPTTGGPSAAVRYFIEAQYITVHDTEWSNDQNNASYIEVSVSNNTNKSMTRISQTMQALTMLQGWSLIDPAVELNTEMIPGDGRIEIASKVTDLGDGQWKYDYVVHNYNSHDSVRSFSIPLPECVEIEADSDRFHDVHHHSGEPYNGNDWINTISATEIKWETDQTFAQNPNANAIRWGTSYSFGFVANTAPDSMDVPLGLFRSGGTAMIRTQVPSGDCPEPDCSHDVAPPGGDGVITIADVNRILTLYGACAGCPEDFLPEGGDGQVSISEINVVLAAYGSTCP
jgi:hypothetical protein